jgi:hypothetical protein
MPVTSDQLPAYTTLGSSLPMPATVTAGNEREQLIVAVTNMALSQPPLIFADRFPFTTGMVEGGQGIVVFARGRDAVMRQFAIKCAHCTCDRSRTLQVGLCN